MKLKLENILKVASADIELGGLTVITGENDSGKSTIGKILFSILKSVNNVRQVDKNKTIQDIRRLLLLIKRLFINTSNESFELLEDLQLISIDLVENNISIEELCSNIEHEAKIRNFPTRRYAFLKDYTSQIKEKLLSLNKPEHAIINEFNAISKSEFMETINSFGKKYSSITFYDDTTYTDGSEFSVVLEKGVINSTNNIRLNGNFSIEDVTYIESPVYLHILNALAMSSSTIVSPSLLGFYSSQRGNIPYHLKDMADKLLNPYDESPSLFDINNEYKSLIKIINNLIGGDFAVDKENKQLHFNREGYHIPTVSVASGIKSFGVLLRMLKTDCISNSKMLVLDEPEIHLHPEWQIKFCQLIIELVSIGIPIVVSSHSPYFIQGLRYYAAEKHIEKDVIYYMAAENKEGLSEFKDVTNDLNKVFSLLAVPLNNIMNIDEVRRKNK